MDTAQDAGRKAPYAPISAVREFFERIRNTAVPPRVDRRFLQRLNVASNNEWALLSALKFLGVVDDRGVPTHAYRQLQRTDRFQETLAHLVRTAYKPLLEAGGEHMSQDDLENYFRTTSSPSQAKNAARFFREMSRMAGLSNQVFPTARGGHARPPSIEVAPAEEVDADPPPAASRSQPVSLLQAKARLLEKLPAPNREWSAQEYKEICDRFLQMLSHLEGPQLEES